MKQFIVITLLLISRGVLAQDYLSADYIEKEDSISFFFRNNTIDTLYLFSSYFDNDLLSAKYLHQIDKYNGDYIISFIPLNPYLSAYLSDRIVFGDSRIITSGQILFKFITLIPESQFELRLSINNVFHNANEKHNVIKIFTEKELRKGKFKTLSYNYMCNPNHYKTVFKFAYYKDIKTLTSKELYLNAGNEAYFKANDYSTVTVRVSSH